MCQFLYRLCFYRTRLVSIDSAISSKHQLEWLNFKLRYYQFAIRIVRSMVTRIGSSRAHTAISTLAFVRHATQTDSCIQTEPLPDLSFIVARPDQQIG